jgi:uncharacterized DUF497 family protein
LNVPSGDTSRTGLLEHDGVDLAGIFRVDHKIVIFTERQQVTNRFARVALGRHNPHHRLVVVVTVPDEEGTEIIVARIDNADTEARVEVDFRFLFDGNIPVLERLEAADVVLLVDSECFLNIY